MSFLNQLGFSSEEINAFVNGDCGYLALALHAETGWPVVTVSPVEDTDWWSHVAVQTPEGMIVDIKGLWDADTFWDLWSSEHYEAEIYPRDIAWITESVHKRPPKFPEYDATVYAREVLERISTYRKGTTQKLQVSPIHAIV